MIEYNMAKKIRVLIVDDSAFIREIFTEMLNEAPDIEVIGAAQDAYDAREKIKALDPDVITLDIEMPKMDGLSFLEKIMTLRPMPVVMVSTLTQKGADTTIRALELGAVDYVSKPADRTTSNIHVVQEALLEKVRAASKARVKARNSATANSTKKPAALPLKKAPSPERVIAIGSSTGGVEALRDILPYLPENCPPVLMVQHMPAQFTTSFAQRLDNLSHITVVEAQNNQRIEAGHAYLAPGGLHMTVKRVGEQLYCKIEDGDNVSGHKPSVDKLFDSVADVIGKEAVGVILTGMGKDGAIGLLKMRESGSPTLGQNEQSCIVYGMPKAAKLNGAVEVELPLKALPQAILNKC